MGVHAVQLKLNLHAGTRQMLQGEGQARGIIRERVDLPGAQPSVELDVNVPIIDAGERCECQVFVVFRLAR